jgi:hypothetical protein
MQGEAMISIGEVTGLFGIIDKVRDYWQTRQESKKLAQIQIVARRFVQLFEMHGVNRNQIPRFFDNSLTLSTLQDDAKLLEVLTSEKLLAAAQLFDVRLDWLEGATDEIYKDKGNFYKNPKRFAEFVDDVLARSDDVNGLLLVGDINRKGKDTACDAFLVIAEAVGHLGDKAIYRYHVCDAWVFSYWKCRAYLTACIATAWKKGLYIHGKHVSAKELEGVEAKTVLPILESIQGERWEPEYMAEDPDLFLDGLAEGDFGKVAALELWLELEAKDWMNYGFGTHRDKFEEALSNFSPSHLI